MKHLCIHKQKAHTYRAAWRISLDSFGLDCDFPSSCAAKLLMSRCRSRLLTVIAVKTRKRRKDNEKSLANLLAHNMEDGKS